MKMTFQEIRIIATGPCITNQLRDVNTIYRRSWYIAAHIWKIYDFRIEVVRFIINFSTDLTTVDKLDQGYAKIRLIRSLKKFIFRYQGLVEIYSVSAEKIINDGFSQTSPFHYGSKFPAVTITVFITILEQNSCQISAKLSEVNVKDTFTSDIDKKNIFDIFVDKRDDFNSKIINFPNMCSNIPASPAYGVYISQLIRYAFHYIKMHRLLSYLQRRNTFRQDLGIGI
jgi:hypothetical protein